MKQRFAHIKVHTEHSAGNSVGTIKHLIEVAAKKEFPCLGITDYATLSGSYSFNKLCTKAGIKPVIGCEFHITEEKDAPLKISDTIKIIDKKIKNLKTKIKDTRERAREKTRLEKKKFRLNQKKNSRTHHIVAIAKNINGLKKLFKVSRDSYNNFYYRPRTDLNTFSHFGCDSDILFVFGDMSSYIAHSLYFGYIDKAISHLQEFKDRNFEFWLEISPLLFPGQRQVNLAIESISKQLQVPLIATNSVHYPEEEDHATLEILKSISKEIRDDSQFMTRGMFLRTRREMYSAFKTFHPELDNKTVKKALDNTLELCDRIENYNFDKSEKLPRLNVNKEDSIRDFKEKVSIGLKNKNINIKEYIDRAEFESDVIIQKGFVDYFLMVADLMQWAKEKDIITGPARGSAAGALVSYSLGITEVDPIQHGLLFERFLAIDRNEYPDIDLDFEKDRRDEILEYLKNKYGSEKVCQIGTNLKYGPSRAIRDVAKAFGVPTDEYNDVLKEHIDPLDDLEKALEDPEIKRFSKEHPLIFKHVRKIVKQIFAFGCHASGVAVSSRNLIEDTPIMTRTSHQSGGKVEVTGFVDGKDERELSEIGIVKIDRLGLKNLDVAKLCISYIKERHNKEIIYSEIPYGSKKVFRQFSKGNTFSIFQFNQRNMRRILSNVQPSSLDDLSCVNALYRPGPIGAGLVNVFINNKHNPDSIEKIHPIVDEILEKTYGVMLYQEQIMEIGKRLAGYSPKETNHLRKIIKKSSGSTSTSEERDENRANFLNGCNKNGVKEKIANKVYSQIESFASYSFNKSHSLSYAIIAYRQMWLLCNYPVEFMTAYLKYQKRQTDEEKQKFNELINECNKIGVRFRVPDINLSQDGISIFEDSIMLGLSSVKGLGPTGAAKIVDNRPYVSFSNFIEKIPDFKGVNKNTISSMIIVGCFDSIIGNLKRIDVLDSLEDIIKSRKRKSGVIKDEELSISNEELDIEVINEELKRSFGIGIKFF